MTVETATALLPAASQRLVRTVDTLPDEAWAGPSLLPGWTRGHVVAHLVLAGEALTGVLRGLTRGERVPMYASDGVRDAAIEDLAAADHAELRTRLLASVTEFADAVAALPPEAWDGTAERTPGGRSFPVSAVPEMRLREVEIHHVDLAAAYRPDDWPAEFSVLLVEGMVARLAAADHGFAVEATDLGRRWTVGDGGPVVSGPAAQLGWWLSGRGTGDGLTSEGELPRTGAW